MRKERYVDAGVFSLAASPIGSLYGMQGAIATINPPVPHVKMAIGILLGGTLAVAGATKYAYSTNAPKVKAAMHVVAKALTGEARTNSDLSNILKKYRYVFVDRKGRIVGTNSPRILGIGRARLESKKIIENKY